jgi:hypothetical protein
MDPDQERFTPTLETIRRRRAELRDALVEAEEALAAPGPGRVEQWCKDVGTALHRLRDTFEGHVRATEGPDGLYAEIMMRAPRFAAKLDRLRDEHQVIRASLDGSIDSLEAAPPETEDEIAEMRDAVQRLLGMIVRHRQLGADLVWDAYNVDIGSPG